MKNDGRINLRLPPELIEWVKEYCARTGTSMSSLVRIQLTRVKAEDDEKLAEPVDAEQI